MAVIAVIPNIAMDWRDLAVKVREGGSKERNGLYY